jgi:hypothetical protein
LPVKPRRVIEIARELRRRSLTPSLVYNVRAADVLAPGFTENMAEFTRQLLVGAESGYDDCLRRIEKVLEGAARLLERQDIAHGGLLLHPGAALGRSRGPPRRAGVGAPDDEMILSG